MDNPTFSCRSRRENLDKPLDKDIQVTGEYGRHKLRLFVEGECVSWVTVLEFQQQIGPEVLRLGGIGEVGFATPDPRRQ